MTDLGMCDHCEAPAAVVANGRRGCLAHLDETFKPIGDQIRALADAVAPAPEALRNAD